MKNKVLIFIAGLVAGVTIGVLFSVAIKELLIQFKELHISLNRINVKQNELSQRMDSIQGKLVPDAKKPVQTPVAIVKPTAPATAKTPATNDNSKAANSKSANTINTMPADTDAVVMTNQLVSVISAQLKNKDTLNKKNVQTDSALESMSDVNDLAERVFIRVEFWKSPLNYKGYKMSRGKVVLYGLAPVPNATIYTLDYNNFLVINQTAFRVEYTDDYKPFERVSDKAILKKLGL